MALPGGALGPRRGRLGFANHPGPQASREGVSLSDRCLLLFELGRPSLVLALRRSAGRRYGSRRWPWRRIRGGRRRPSLVVRLARRWHRFRIGCAGGCVVRARARRRRQSIELLPRRGRPRLGGERVGPDRCAPPHPLPLVVDPTDTGEHDPRQQAHHDRRDGERDRRCIRWGVRGARRSSDRRHAEHVPAEGERRVPPDAAADTGNPPEPHRHPSQHGAEVVGRRMPPPSAARLHR